MTAARRPEREGPSLVAMGGWALFFLLLAAWAGQNVFHCAGESALVGQPAPAFDTAVVAGEGASSDRVSQETLRGRVVLLDFWASWCGPCRASIPILSRLAQRHAAAGLVTLGVNIEAEQAVRHVIRAHSALGAGFPSVHDEGWRMQSAYGVETIPTLVLIDRRGVVRSVEVGVPSESALDAQIREMLAER